MLEEVEAIAMPARSRLFSLKMRGSCGATQESLFDYAQRLSAAHLISGRRAFTDIYLPEANRSNLGKDGSMNCKLLKSMNGTSGLAEDLVDAMERLTGRKDLASGTLLPWRGVIGDRVSFSQYRKWCPDCLIAQGDAEQFSFSLLWTLKAVSACPLHKRSLACRCGKCGKEQPRMNEAMPFGRCAYCDLSLRHSSHACEQQAKPKSIAIAAAAAQMIETNIAGAAWASLDNYRNRIRHLVAAKFGGSERRLWREINMERGLGRCEGVSIDSLLELTYRLGTTPVEFLRGDVGSAFNVRAVTQAYRPRPRLSATEKAAVGEKLRALLGELAQSCVPMSEAAVASSLGLKACVLPVSFAAEKEALRLHNQTSRPLKKARREAAQIVAIRTAMESLIKSRRPTTRRSICATLLDFGVRWHSASVLIMCRAELGVLSREQPVGQDARTQLTGHAELSEGGLTSMAALSSLTPAQFEQKGQECHHIPPKLSENAIL